ncbi:MAG: hypothetical protein ACR2LA_05720 [Acidimicrobiales bacterium]
MDSPDTVTEAINHLRAEGYPAEVELVDGCLCWDKDGRTTDVAEAEVEGLYRFEGPSDPGDEMVVFALRDPETDRRGVLASAFGSAADPEVLDQVVGLSQRYHQA